MTLEEKIKKIKTLSQDAYAEAEQEIFIRTVDLATNFVENASYKGIPGMVDAIKVIAGWEDDEIDDYLELDEFLEED